jgi:hypothetical protein
MAKDRVYIRPPSTLSRFPCTSPRGKNGNGTIYLPWLAALAGQPHLDLGLGHLPSHVLRGTRLATDRSWGGASGVGTKGRDLGSGLGSRPWGRALGAALGGGPWDQSLERRTPGVGLATGRRRDGGKDCNPGTIASALPGSLPGCLRGLPSGATIASCSPCRAPELRYKGADTRSGWRLNGRPPSLRQDGRANARLPVSSLFRVLWAFPRSACCSGPKRGFALERKHRGGKAAHAAV